MIAEIIRKVRRLLVYTKGYHGKLVAGLLFVSFSQLISVWMIADLLGNSVRAIQARDMSMLLRAVFFAMPWLAAMIVFNFLAQYFFGTGTARAAAAMRSHLLGLLLKTSLGSSQASHSGVKLSLFTNDINAAFDSLVTTLAKPVSAVIVGIVCLIYVLRVHWAFAVIAGVIGLFTCLYSIWFAKRLHGIAQKMQSFLAALESRMKDILDGMVVSRIYGMREKLENGMAAASGDLCKEGIRWAKVSGVLGAVNNAVSHFSERILIFAGGLFFLSELISLPELMRVTEMAGGIIGVFHVSRMLIGVQRSLAGAQRVFDVIDGADPEPTGAVTAAGIRNPVLVFSDVVFGYNPDQPVLKKFSFELAEGEMVVLNGPSGGGKSTVLRLAQGLYLSDSGSVSFMGVPVNEWDTVILRRHLSLVPQEPVLFPGTVAENIALGSGDFDMERIRTAAAQAYAGDFIMSMPQGYDTQIAERGASLSGGQRQRIAIARALYRDASVLLLDEATSAMDSGSEAAVHKMLSELRGKKTILYVSHRQAAQRLADRVLTVG